MTRKKNKITSTTIEKDIVDVKIDNEVVEEKPTIITQIDPIDKLILSIQNGVCTVTKDERTGARIGSFKLANGRVFDMNLDCGDEQHIRNKLFFEGVIING